MPNNLSFLFRFATLLCAARFACRQLFKCAEQRLLYVLRPNARGLVRLSIGINWRLSNVANHRLWSMKPGMQPRLILGADFCNYSPTYLSPTAPSRRRERFELNGLFSPVRNGLPTMPRDLIVTIVRSDRILNVADKPVCEQVCPIKLPEPTAFFPDGGSEKRVFALLQLFQELLVICQLRSTSGNKAGDRIAFSASFAKKLGPLGSEEFKVTHCCAQTRHEPVASLFVAIGCKFQQSVQGTACQQDEVT